jgi:hypothetical protein
MLLRLIVTDKDIVVSITGNNGLWWRISTQDGTQVQKFVTQV